ncbi:MAG TPA: phage recombination protein Bet [Gaiellaceae bacterium]|nr:phage recombination protein Bet [Gaiellaceae bacterium]
MATPPGTPAPTALAKLDLPEPVARRGINEAQWRTLMGSLYPGARAESVLMVLDYCKSRGLDPMKKPCHIVPMEVKVAGTDRYEWRDVVMPGIYELRTTAQRTGSYLGHSKPEYGPAAEYAGVTAPEWCEMTFYRWNGVAQQRIEFPVRVYFREVVATKQGGKANARWARAPIQMLEKCTEAKGLRETCPDEIGGESTAEEMDGQRASDAPPAVVVSSAALVKPDGYDDWITDLTAAADEGAARFDAAWEASKKESRQYLMATEPEALPLFKARAERVDATKDATGDLLS